MPLNEILAASYVKVFYHVLVNINHQFRLYFDEVPTLDGDDGWLFGGYTDAGHAGGWHLNEIITEVVERHALDTSRATEKTIDSVEMWESASGDNIFMGLDPADYTDIDPATGEAIASAYDLYNFKSALRFPFRLTFFDTADSKPQRFAVGTAPAVDDGGLNWFMTKSAVGFCTNDGYPLAQLASLNTGYNRKLARRYGRQIIP